MSIGSQNSDGTSTIQVKKEHPIEPAQSDNPSARVYSVEELSPSGRQETLKFTEIMCTGWISVARPAGEEGHMEPTSLDLLAFVTQFELIRKGISWKSKEQNGSSVLNSCNPNDEFGTYLFDSGHAEVSTPIVDEGFFHRIGHLFSRATKEEQTIKEDEGTEPDKKADGKEGQTIQLCRSNGKYNRLIYHTLQRLLDFDSRLAEEYSSLSSRIGTPLFELSEVLKVVRQSVLGESVTWDRVVTMFKFAAAIAAHCIEDDRLSCIDLLIADINKFIFIERINPWISENGGWVSFLFLLQILLIIHLTFEFFKFSFHFFIFRRNNFL